MNSTQFPKALIILLVITLLIIGVFFYFASPIPIKKYTSSFQEYPDPVSQSVSVPEQVVEVTGFIHAFDIAPSGDKIAIATSKEVALYDLQTLKKIHVYLLEDQVVNMRFSPDGNKFAISGNIPANYQTNQTRIIVLDTSSWEEI